MMTVAVTFTDGSLVYYPDVQEWSAPANVRECFRIDRKLRVILIPAGQVKTFEVDMLP